MINVLRSEWIKLRTVRMNWILGIIAFAFPVVITLLTAFFSGDDEGFTARTLVEVLTGTAVVAALLCGVIAAASITGEFGFGTIRPTFAAVPRRTRVVAAKAIVVVTASTVLLVLADLTGIGIGRLLAEGQGATIDFSDVPTALPALTGTVVLAGLMALAGYGLGLLTRSTPAAISILIVWPLIAEGLIGALIGLISGWHNVVQWMPFQAGIRLVFVGTDFFDGPSRVVSGLYFGGVAAALTIAGAIAVDRRDA
ncbi:MAG: ABC transporter permease [Actinobacteria bacterium]|nr:ABC transporter permease [Actinomycetota bacterium]